MTETHDAVIIGGGVMGASIACHLAQRNYGSILLLEREALCAGSTGRSVASVDLLTQHPEIMPLHLASLRAFQHCAELYGDGCGWVETGFAVLAGAKDADGLREVARVVSEAGGCIRFLCADDYRRLDPACECGDAALISYAPGCGFLDPVLLTNTFVNAARRGGAVVRQYEPAIRLCRTGERVMGVRTRGEDIAAGVLVVAAGPWTADFLRPEGIDLPLQPQRRDAALFACAPEASPRPSIFDLINSVYARPETGGLTVAGSLDLAVGYADICADDECPAPPLEYGLWVWERLVNRYPGMESGELRKGWSGSVTLSPDGQPLLGSLPLDGLYCACGFSGAGLKIAPAVGDLIAGLIAGEQSAAETLQPLRPSRFAEDEPLVSRFAWGTLA